MMYIWLLNGLAEISYNMYYKSVISTEEMTILADFKWASLDLTPSQMEGKMVNTS